MIEWCRHEPVCRTRFEVKLIPERRGWGNPWGIYDHKLRRFIDRSYKYRRMADSVAKRREGMPEQGSGTTDHISEEITLNCKSLNKWSGDEW